MGGPPAGPAGSRSAKRFAENDISFAVLPDLTDQDLKEIGVSLGHRRQLLRAIAKLPHPEEDPPKYGAFHVSCKKNLQDCSRLTILCRRLHATWMRHGIERAYSATHDHDSENRERNTRVEIHMDQPVNAFDLSPEQQETASLLQRLLGSAIASRYVDFCRLSAGSFSLNVSRPIAAHALRELDSMLRGALEVPMEARATETEEDAKKIAIARDRLREIGFEDEVIDSAAEKLKPRLNHKQQIRQIASRLGLAPDGDVAKGWTSLTDSSGRAHERSFHRSLKVDDDFRGRYQRPFDTVIRAFAVALQGRYVALLRRVEELAAMTDRKQAAKLFASEIPGALALQRHFFESLQTADWLPHLVKQGLLAEPLAGPDEGANGGMRFRQWPAGNYLLRMAKSADAATRQAVAKALRNLGASKHPDVQYNGLEILAALPPEESAPLADLASSWLSPGTRNWPMQTPEVLIKKLTQGGQRDAALKVARALLQIWEQNGHLVTHYAQHMYEHHLPSLVGPLAACCREDALRLFAALLQEAAGITRRTDSGHYSMRPLGDDGMAQHDVYESLISAVRRSAEALIQEDAARMRGVVELLAGYEPKIFVRLYLHVLASSPAATPDLATAYLTDPSLIEAGWCRDEYLRLALAWFPSLTPEDKGKVLGVIDAMPDKYLNAWKARFEKHMKKSPDAEDERKFRAATFRDVVWKWRAALPAERQEALDRTVQELGDPDAWKEQLFPQEESPLRGSDFSSRPVPDIVEFLKSWRPEAEGSRQTVTALAQELRIAVANSPETYAVEAAQFAGLKTVYVRQVLEGLAMAANNRRKFEMEGRARTDRRSPCATRRADRLRNVVRW
jgi:SAM domain (Sterile alpha motif)